jgi:hypothetical protein
MWRITHFVPRRPEHDAWAKLTFYTLTRGKHGYFCGFNTKHPFSKKELEKLVADGVVEPLPRPVKILETERLWIGPAFDIWVADAKAPLDDKARRQVLPGDPARRQRQKSESLIERIFAREERGIRRLISIDKKFVANPLYSKFVRTLVQRLANDIGAQEWPRPRLEPQMRWDYIGSHFRSGSFDFCYDPYFLSPNRACLVDVIQYGVICDLTVFVDTKSPLYPELASYAKDGLGLRETLVKLAEHNKFEIGVLGECASSTELIEILSDYLGILSYVNTMRDEIEMRWWIESSPERRIIVGEIGLVPMLENVTAKQISDQGRPVPEDFGHRTFVANDKYTRFPLTQPHPVGFVCLHDDELWQSHMRDAFAHALLVHQSDIPWEGCGKNTMSTMLRQVGVEAFSLKRLLVSLKREDIYIALKEQELNSAIDVAIKSEKYEEAVALKKTLSRLGSGETSEDIDERL